MREIMPGRPDPAKDVYEPDTPRDTSAWDRLVAEIRSKAVELANGPHTRPDEFAIAAAEVERRQQHRRDARWHRARMALGG